MPNPKGHPATLTNMGKGRKKGSKNKCTQAKEDFFKWYFRQGRLKALDELASDAMRCHDCGFEFPYKSDAVECPHCKKKDLRVIPRRLSFLNKFLTDVLPTLMPKRADVDLKGTPVVILEAAPILKPANSGMSSDDD